MKKCVFVSRAPALFSQPRHFEIIYNPMLDSSLTMDYPNDINGYKKFIPKSVDANVLYIDVVK